ncbi:MAG TPA: ATP-binding protein [Tepiditoga sp.]|nr:ATP-binding protein [Thermotogota bacterium]HOO74572.1 ATP-binding protein [Tepiditoga sp.]
MITKNYEIKSEKTFKIFLENDNEYIISIVNIFSSEAGFNHTESTIISTAVSELTTNIIRYAKSGEVSVKIIYNSETDETGIEITAGDNGPKKKDLL